MREEREGTAEERGADDIGGQRDKEEGPSDGGRGAASTEKRSKENTLLCAAK